MKTKEDILKYFEEINPKLKQDDIVKISLFGDAAKKLPDVDSVLPVYIETTEEFAICYYGFDGLDYLRELEEKLTEQFKRKVRVLDIPTMIFEKREDILHVIASFNTRQCIEKFTTKISKMCDVYDSYKHILINDESMGKPLISEHILICNDLLQKIRTNVLSLDEILSTEDLERVQKACENIALGFENIDWVLMDKTIDDALLNIDDVIMEFFDVNWEEEKYLVCSITPTNN